MAEEQVAFDNWEEEAEIQLTKQTINEQAQQETKAQTKPIEEASQVKQQKKPEPVDPQKLFNQRFAAYGQINEEKFQTYFENAKELSTNQQVVISNQILKNDKDFAQFAKKVGKKLNNVLNQSQLQNLEDDHIHDFFEEVLLLVYNQLQWRNIQSTKEKLRIVKKEKKEEEVKLKKQKEKEERMKKIKGANEEQSVSQPNQNKVEDDIFGGATLINSKQIQEQIKAKGLEKVQVKKVVQDDDDFM